jgi:hypothetical protein
LKSNVGENCFKGLGRRGVSVSKDGLPPQEVRVRSKRLPLLSKLAISALFTAAIPGYATQVQTAQNRVPQQVAINGQTVNAVSVVAEGGGLQTYRCVNPQQYSTLDGASQGWACYDQATGVWLLNALPPTQAQVPQPQPQVQYPPVQRAPLPVPQPQAAPPVVTYPQQPSVVYQQPPVVVYQQPPIVYQPATVVYQQPPVVYQPAVVYGTPVYPVYPRPVVVAPAYPSSVVLGAAAIGAAGRIISAAVYGGPRVAYVGPYYRGRIWRR